MICLLRNLLPCKVLEYRKVQLPQQLEINLKYKVGIVIETSYLDGTVVSVTDSKAGGLEIESNSKRAFYKSLL